MCNYRFFTKPNTGDYTGTTYCDRAYYEFEVETKKLFDALHLLSRCLLKPSWTDEMVWHEHSIINLEFESQKYLEEHRRFQIFRTVIQDDHPMTKFCWGNNSSLNGDGKELKDKLLEFHKQYFICPMFACIRACISLDIMEVNRFSTFMSSLVHNANSFQEMFLNSFGNPREVQEANVAVWKFPNVFNKELSENLFIVEPIADINELNITFCLESIEPHEKRLYEFIGFLLDHKGKGSLTSHFRKKFVFPMSLLN